ncbi:unannotated protein [freshwater metagenome]|uniref:Unannotated protein n=1 Tax=freshwater metagenome TaxID=449393 RepID=A0A6J6Z6T9_9ZZZZ
MLYVGVGCQRPGFGGAGLRHLQEIIALHVVTAVHLAENRRPRRKVRGLDADGATVGQFDGGHGKQVGVVDGRVRENGRDMRTRVHDILLDYF